MNNEYYTIKELTEDRSLKINGVLAIVLSIAGIAVGVFAVSYHRIWISPIADVRIAESSKTGGIDAADHIISTAEFVAMLKDNKIDTLAVGSRISTYATPLNVICDGNTHVLSKDNVVIATSSNNEVVGTIKASQDVCNSLRRLRSDEKIYVASEKPVAGADSKPVFMTISDLR